MVMNDLARLLLFSVLIYFVHNQVMAMDGPLVVSDNGHWFKYRDSGKPFFMAGVGGPEGFLFETDARKQQIVDQLVSSGANALYVHTIRSFEGDGFSFEDPYNIHEDIDSGVNDATLANWRGYFDQLDANKIVTWIHILDDTARPWGCSVPLSTQAKSYIQKIVETFRDIDHLVWLSGEEFLMGRCTTAQDKALMSAIAAEIRLHDSVHPIGVHHNNGQAMQFADDPVVNVFAQQICGNSNVRNPNGIHSSASFGDWVYVMAECHPWHKDLIESSNRESLRLSNWATAMGGGYVLMYDAYECPNKLCTRNSDGSVKNVTPGHDPSVAMLNDLARLHRFMSDSQFSILTPTDSLARGGTQWVLANPAADVYIAYAGNSPTIMGVSGLIGSVNYKLTWLDAVTGLTREEIKRGDQSPFPKPSGFGNEVALSIVTESPSSGNRPPVANSDNYKIVPDGFLVVAAADGVLSNDTDFNGDALTAELVVGTQNGQLELSADGGFTYRPNIGFEGQDSFTYRANDSEDLSGTVRVLIDVTIQPVVAMWLVNAETDQRILRLVNNDVININQLGFSQFSIEAVIGNAGSVKMTYSGIVSGSQTESQVPYAMFGDNNSDFDGRPLTPGALSVTSTAYSATNASGAVVAEATINIVFSKVTVEPPEGSDDLCVVLKTKGDTTTVVCL